LRALSLVAVTVCSWLIAGCGRFGIAASSPGDAAVTQPDANTRVDAAVPSDAGVAPRDAGGLADGGVYMRDASVVVPDAGSAPRDAGGPMRDAGGPARDAGGSDAGCPVACANAHGSADCMSGTCQISCDTGFDNCDGDVANGCETALDTTTSCGACTAVCPDAMADATARCIAGMCDYTCNDASGVYALRITAQATWPATPYILAGSGTLQFWYRLTLTQAGTALTGSLALCDQTTPETRNSITTDRYFLDYPSVLFNPGPPVAPFSATLASQAPGAALTSTRTAHLAGVSLSDALNAAWPARATVLANQVDHDGDGKVGITVAFVDDATYNHAQTDGTLTAARASHTYGAQRVRFSLAGALTGCSAASGPANVESFDTKTIGCRLESNADCNASQYGHIDDNAAVYTPVSGNYTLTKLGAPGSSFTCAQVRAAL
jgi:hypothetical protein